MNTLCGLVHSSHFVTKLSKMLSAAIPIMVPRSSANHVPLASLTPAVEESHAGVFITDSENECGHEFSWIDLFGGISSTILGRHQLDQCVL